MALIQGTSGRDFLYGNYESDLMMGGAGDDVLLSYGDPIGSGTWASFRGQEASTGADALYGGDGNDYLMGGFGGDCLFGGTGDDTLIGSAGTDTLSGGAGADVFTFGPPGGPWPFTDTGTAQARDTVIDFEQGQDKVDLHHYLTPGVWEDATYLGQNGQVSPSHQLQVAWYHEAGDTVVAFYAPSLRGGDPSGEPLPVEGWSGEIKLVGQHWLTQDDFLI